MSQPAYGQSHDYIPDFRWIFFRLGGSLNLDNTPLFVLSIYILLECMAACSQVWRPSICRQPTILHTTLARLLKPPEGSSKAGVQQLTAAMAGMTNELCGLETTLREVWYIQERHLLALALNGAYSKDRAQLTCPAEISL